MRLSLLVKLPLSLLRSTPLLLNSELLLGHFASKDIPVLSLNLLVKSPFWILKPAILLVKSPKSLGIIMFEAQNPTKPPFFMVKAASFLVKSSMSATAPRTAQVNGPCVAWNRAICPQHQRQAVRCCPRPSWARRENAADPGFGSPKS